MMLRYFFISLAFCIAAVIFIAGVRGHIFTQPPVEIFNDMARQPGLKAQAPGDFFADGRADRPPPPGTVPLGYAPPQEPGAASTPGAYDGIQFSSGNSYAATGKIGGVWGAGIPFHVSRDVMLRGQERYGIFCASCHGATGLGDGIVSQYGMVAIANLDQRRIREMAEGEIFNTITHGRGAMLGFGDRIPVPDRWAIICYLRALQKSQGAGLSDVPAEELSRLKAK